MVKTVFILACVFCTVNSCNAQEKNTDQKLLAYDNYTHKRESLPLSFKKYDLKVITLKIGDTLKVDMPSYKGIILNKEDKLFHFLCEQDIISGWLYLRGQKYTITTKESNQINRKYTKQEMINGKKSIITHLKLIGNIKIAKNFISTLIQTDVINSESASKKLYLVNHKDYEILSITKVAHYLTGEDVIKANTIWQGRHKFILYDDLIHGHVINDENPNYYEEESPEKVVFMIAKNGKIQLLD